MVSGRAGSTGPLATQPLAYRAAPGGPGPGTGQPPNSQGHGRPAGDSVLCVLSGDSRLYLPLPSLFDPVSQPDSPSLCVSPRTPGACAVRPPPPRHTRTPCPLAVPHSVAWIAPSAFSLPCPVLLTRPRWGEGGPVSAVAVSRKALLSFVDSLLCASRKTSLP